MTPKLKELEAARDALATALSASTAGNRELVQVERDRASVMAQLEKLEAQTERDPDDESAVGRLATLREQHRLFDRKIAKLQERQLRDESPARLLDNATQSAASLLIESTRPELNKLLDDARTALAPFYRDPFRLRMAVEGNDRVLSLKAFLVNAGVGLPNEKPKRLLSLLDGLIAGSGLGWTWQLATATDSK